MDILWGIGIGISGTHTCPRVGDKMLAYKYSVFRRYFWALESLLYDLFMGLFHLYPSNLVSFTSRQIPEVVTNVSVVPWFTVAKQQSFLCCCPLIFLFRAIRSTDTHCNTHAWCQLSMSIEDCRNLILDTISSLTIRTTSNCVIHQ